MQLLKTIIRKNFNDFYRYEGLRIFVSGQSGSGKSYLSKSVTEELLPYFRIIVVDPEGEWKAIKSLKEAIIIGSNGDVPLDKTMYEHYLETGINLVFNLKSIFHTEKEAIMGDIFKEIYRWSKPSIVIIEEADIAAPEKRNNASKPFVIEIAKRGRKRGMGLIAATQRPADISKAVVSQCNFRFFGKMIDNSDLDAMKNYFRTAEINAGMVSSLNNGDFFCYDGTGTVKLRSPGISMPDLGSSDVLVFDEVTSQNFNDAIRNLNKLYEVHGGRQLSPQENLEILEERIKQASMERDYFKQELESLKSMDNISAINQLIHRNQELQNDVQKKQVEIEKFTRIFDSIKTIDPEEEYFNNISIPDFDQDYLISFFLEKLQDRSVDVKFRNILKNIIPHLVAESGKIGLDDLSRRLPMSETDLKTFISSSHLLKIIHINNQEIIIPPL